MKLVLPTMALALFLAACSQSSSSPQVLDPQMVTSYRQQRTFDMWALDSAQDAATKNAILEEHAIYDYHFTANSAVLTELGQRDLAVLAESYKVAPGPLSLVRGDTAEALYGHRREAVMAALQQAGVAADRVAISDTYAGGRGLSGNSLVESLRAKASYSGSSTDTGSVTQTGTTPPAGNPGAK